MSTSSSGSPRRVAFVILGVSVLCVVALVTTVMCWRVRLNGAVNAQLRALKAAGLPTSGAELNAWYGSVPDRDNAALAITQAFPLMRTFPDQRSNEVVRLKPPLRGRRLTPEQGNLARDYLQLNEAALAKARSGMVLPRSRYPVDLTQGPDAPMHHLARIRGLARMADFEAVLALEAGTSEGVVNGISMILGLARSLDPEPVVLSQLTRATLIKMAVANLERSVEEWLFKDAELLGLANTFASAQATNLMARALIGERAALIPRFRMGTESIKRLTASDDGSGDSPGGLPSPGSPPLISRLTGFFERDLGFFLSAMETNIVLQGFPPPQSLAAAGVSERLGLEARRKLCVLSSLFLPSFEKTSIREADEIARLRTANTALAIERFRLANGRLPNGLAELVPQFLSAVPADPFDGTPLRYKQLPKGYVVYSIGPDGRDDGGKEFPVPNRSPNVPPYDIPFTVE